MNLIHKVAKRMHHGPETQSNQPVENWYAENMCVVKQQ